ncbi:helicase-associated domain-containing protein [Paenibacillus sophorae]|uniref:DNA 3'-5' helicase n=2 Tax=Paenibacillus sophorae TaxID=1333845 RepID=A0ABX8H5R1_9BACL|nr:DNA repair helicase XPB [Paenibacillus sophorae]QWU13470.1 helicase-associated domain-containing protein [Paenibacillus sophorae]
MDVINMGPCLVRKDRTVLLDCSHPEFEAARDRLPMFAELVKSPPLYHTYRITPLSLWNAAALGASADGIAECLELLSGRGLPSGLSEEIKLLMSRYGRLTLYSADGEERLLLRGDSEELLNEPEVAAAAAACGFHRTGPVEMTGNAARRGMLKQELAGAGYPVLDSAGYHEGEALDISWKEGDDSFELRDYQREAAERFEAIGGSGIIVLPCGAGKTIVGLAVLEASNYETLILTSNATSVRQWTEELKMRTNLAPESIGEYTGERRQVRPVTVATYQMLTHRVAKGDGFKHMGLFNERNWGLIIYDEVHLLPAPVFRATAEIQATRRLGLTATLVREDGREGDVFSLIGPKIYDCPWKTLERRGWIAAVQCLEVPVPMEPELKKRYLYGTAKEKFRLASANPVKAEIAVKIIKAHKGASILVIGQYLDQLTELAAIVGAPVITGKTPQKERLKLYNAFNEGILPVLVVSKVANFAVNLPDASVAIEVSGAFGSRQEEAQRLGRVLRPKQGDNRAFFYTLVTEDSREQEFALRRRLFLTEQGYEYTVMPKFCEESEIRFEEPECENPHKEEASGS